MRGIVAGVALISVLMFPAGRAQAQTVYTPPLIQFSYYGSWEGAYDWANQVALPPGAFQCTNPAQAVAVLENELGHAMLLPTGPHAGKVLLWNYVLIIPECFDYGTTRAWLFDPDNPGSLITIDEDSQDSVFTSSIFCGGHSWRPDGTLLVAGGFQGLAPPPPPGQPPSPSEQPSETYVFDPTVLGVVAHGQIPWNPSIWSDPFDLAEGRYYPTVIALGRRSIEARDGQGAVTWSTPGASHLVLGGISGTADNTSWNKWFEASAPTGFGWSVPLVPDIALQQPPAQSKTYERYDLSGAPVPSGVEAEFTKISNYPRAFQLSNDDIYMAAHVPFPHSNDAWVLRPPPESTSGPTDWQLHESDPVPGTVRKWSTAVLLHLLGAGGQDRVLLFGGMESDRSVQEYRHSTGQWVAKADMLHSRDALNAVVLPTGEVFLVGGTATVPAPDGYNFEPELYDPGRLTTDLGSTQMAQPRPADPAFPVPTNHAPRRYHSLAVLLQDGRVLVCGGDDEGDEEYPPAKFTGEIYSPPYFFQGQRPTIGTVANAAYLWSFPSEQPVPFQARVRAFHQGIERVVLLRPSALTHHFDNDQRYIELNFTVPPNPDWANGVLLDIFPPEDKYAPPGYYMLFVLDRNGDNLLPSMGEFIQLLP